MTEAKNRKKEKTYFINCFIYEYYRGDLKESGIRQRPAFTHQGVHYFLFNSEPMSATVSLPDTFTVSGKETVNVKDTLKKENINKKIFRWINQEDIGDWKSQNPKFVDVINILQKDPQHEKSLEFYMRAGYNNLGCVKLKSVEMLDKNGKKYNIMDENLTDISYTSIYNRYVHTPIKMDATTIKNAIEKGNHIEKACWMNALQEFYGDTLMSERTRKRLTVDSIMQITGRKDLYDNGLTINDMDKVFREYGITARIFNFCNQVIYQYTPPRANWRIKAFYAMVKNNHVYVLNHDLKSIQQKQNSQKIPTVNATTDYYINDKDKPAEYKMIENCNDILKIHTTEEKEMYLVSKGNNLNEIFFELMNGGYEPRIKFQAGCISDIRIKFDKTIYNIRKQTLRADVVDGCIAVNREDTYNNMNKAMFNFNKGLINPLHKSFYNDIDIKILQETRTVVATGVLNDIPTNKRKSLIEIDRSKAFTSALLHIKKIPIFTQFDVWTKYNKEIHDITKMNEMTLYYVKSLNMQEHNILFNKDYCLLYGVFLQQLDLNKIDILYFKIPSKRHDVDYSTLVNELWKDTISDDVDEDKMIKKTIANVNIGLLEKLGSTDIKSIPFKTVEEALHHQEEFGGKLYKFEKETIDVDDDDTGMYSYSSNVKQEDEQAPVYILNLTDKAQLKNGFVYIKELLLQYHNFRMYSDYKALTKSHYTNRRDLIQECIDKDEGYITTDLLEQKRLEKLGVKIYSVKNDAFTICKDDLDKAKARLEFNDKIGSWRVSKNSDDLILPSNKYEVNKNELIEIPTYSNKPIGIKDEYATNDIIDNILQARTVLIKAKYPGSGKSFIAERMRDRGYKVLFVCNTNKLVQKYGDDAKTANVFFGISFGNAKLQPFDYSNYDVICFDEIYCHGQSVLNKIREFALKNTDKIIIATGDARQMKPIVDLTNTQHHEVYANKCLNVIFKYTIDLQICKRLKTEDDKQKLSNIYDDIFVHKLSILKIIDKYFKYTDDITASNHNIAYLNHTCKEVSKRIREMQNKKNEYEIGEEVICREYIQLKDKKFNVNFKYVIRHITDEVALLENVATNEKQFIPLNLLRKHFIFSYCFTAHSVQGASVDESITIFDYTHWRVDREWFWTCITRARDLNQVRFYRYSNDTEDIFNKRCITNYLTRKIQTYKEQDKAGKRPIDNDHYIDAEWMLERINSCCNRCGVDFTLEINKGAIYSNFTAQRIQNNICHSKENCIAYCKRCNCSESNKCEK